MNTRQELIVRRLAEQVSCDYGELARLADVSIMTIRRDVDVLAEKGMVIKTLRGCRKASDPSSALLHETSLFSRINNQAQEKRAIAETAMAKIHAGETVYLDGSTTCLELARCIANDCREVTVVTHSAMVGMTAGVNNANVVIVIGGQYDTPSASFVGPVAEEIAGRYFFDRVFISTKGFVPREGTFESALPTFRIKQIVVGRCKQVILLVDHTKFGQRALSKVLDVSQIHEVVTDAATPQRDLAPLQRRGIRVWIAAKDQGDGCGQTGKHW